MSLVSAPPAGIPNNRWLAVEGDRHARFLAQGRFARPQVAAIFAAIGDLEGMPRALPRSLLNAGVRALLTAIGMWRWRRDRPALAAYRGGKHLETVAALAEGCGVSPAALYGLAAMETLTSNLPYEPGCSAFGFAAEATQLGRPLLAYNHDFPPAFGAFNLLRLSRPTDGYAHLSLTYPVALGVLAGLNEAGLALSVNHAHVIDHHRRPSVLISLLALDALEHCASVAEVVDALDRVTVPNGSMISVVDARGSRAVIELSATRTRVRWAQAPVEHTFNTYRHEEMAAVEVPRGAVARGFAKGYDIHGPNLARQARYERRQSTAPSTWSEAAIVDLLADHGDGTPSSLTICRHECVRAQTLLSLILDPQAGQLRVLFGKPCEGALSTVSLSRASAHEDPTETVARRVG